MRKVVSIILVLLMLVNTALAYTSTVQVNGLGLTVTSDEGNVVEIIPKTSEITGWTVKSGNTTVTDNKFVMPGGDVVIEGVTKTGYVLTVEMPDFTRTENKEAGESVTVEALATNDGYTFKNWTATGITLTSSQQTSQTITFIMPSNDVKLVANYTQVSQTYTISYNVNNGTGTIASQTKTHGVDLTLTNSKPTRSGYNFLGWAISSSATSAEYASGGIFTANADTTLYAVWKARTVNIDTSGANAPVLTTGLTPVNWDGSNWVETTETGWEYNYNSVAQAIQSTVAGNKDGAWANAMTADGSLYVWIPRYTYKITSGYHSEGNSWNNLERSGTNKIEIKFSSGVIDDVTSGVTNASEGFIKQPAFTFGDDELEGIWVAKYEASQGTNTTTTNVVSIPTSSNYVAQFKPEVEGWRNISISKMYEYAYNTFRNADSHLMKGSEWGAVAYLTNAIGRIPYENKHTVYTGRSHLNDGSSNSWNTVNGVKASTTHNVYGIYDMAGGAAEYVSAYGIDTGSVYLSEDVDNKEYGGVLYTNRNTKYVETYETVYTSERTGDAMYETTNSNVGMSWDFGSSLINGYFFMHGGSYGDNYISIFAVSNRDGRADSTESFRAVLSIK